MSWIRNTDEQKQFGVYLNVLTVPVRWVVLLVLYVTNWILFLKSLNEKSILIVFNRIIVAGIRSVPGREHTRPALQRDQVQGPALRHPQAPQEQHQAHFQVSLTNN
jgi:hypothetical protein